MTREELYLHARVIETRSSRDVGERVGHERVGGRSIEGAARPETLGQRDRARADFRRDARFALHFAEIVEDADGIAVGNRSRVRVVGIEAWPSVPKGEPWKDGVCRALGHPDPRRFWRELLAAVESWKDLEQPFVAAVEQLVDFVTAP